MCNVSHKSLGKTHVDMEPYFRIIDVLFCIGI